MISTQYVKLNMVPNGIPPVLYCSQYDVGRPLGLVVYNGGEAVDLDSYTCTIEATRTDGTAITTAVTTDDNIGAFVTTATMTNKKDKYLAKLVLFDSDSRKVASLAFVMCVTPTTMDENAESIEEDKSLYQQYTETVQTFIAEIREDLADLKNHIEEAYVTPIMYGAKGDGVTDDTAAMRLAIQSGKCVNLINKTYLITGALSFSGLESVELFNGTITRPAKKTFNTIDGSGCQNINIHDVIFEGNGNTSDVTYTWRSNIQACCILAGGGKNIVFSNNTVRGFNYGVFILGTAEQGTETGTSFSGTITGNVFQNCNSPVDTYGKGMNISFNSFLDITGQALQIEPNGTITNEDAPYESTNDYMCAADCVIQGNYFKNIDQWCIVLHGNTYAINIESNLFMDFAYGVSANRCLYPHISKNSFFAQKSQGEGADTRPWSIEPCVMIIHGKVSDNYFRNVYVGVRAVGGAIVVNNQFVNVKMSGIVMYFGTAYTDDLLSITGNSLDGLANGTYWYGCRFLTMEQGNAILSDNVCESERQPLHTNTNSAKLQIRNLQSNIPFTGAYTQYTSLSVFDEYTTVQKEVVTSYLKNRTGGTCFIKKMGKLCILTLIGYKVSADISGDLFSSAIPSEYVPSQEFRGVLTDLNTNKSYIIWTRATGVFGCNSQDASAQLNGQLVYMV